MYRVCIGSHDKVADDPVDDEGNEWVEPMTNHEPVDPQQRD